MKSKTINLIKNVSLIEEIFRYELVIVPMGINNSFSKGFLHELYINFKSLEKADLQTGYGDKRKLGTVIVSEDKGIVFCLCYALLSKQNKYKTKTVDLTSLESCLQIIKKHFHKKKIAFPLIYGLENDDIYRILANAGIECDVYDYTPNDYELMMYRRIAELRKRKMNKEINNEAYIKERSKIEWERKNGIYNPMPDDYKYVPKKDKNKIKYKLKK